MSKPKQKIKRVRKPIPKAPVPAAPTRPDFKARLIAEKAAARAAAKSPRVSELLKELESGKHKTKGIERPNMGAMRVLLEIAKKNTYKGYKYPNMVRSKARKYAGIS